jgi:hypothetical protein
MVIGQDLVSDQGFVASYASVPSRFSFVART